METGNKQQKRMKKKKINNHKKKKKLYKKNPWKQKILFDRLTLFNISHSGYTIHRFVVFVENWFGSKKDKLN